MAAMTDEQFFATYPDRQARIRLPVKGLVKDAQRGVHYEDECRGEFWTLGPHDKNRRRLLIWRVPEGNPHFDPIKPKLLKIPFLAYSDESIEDSDHILLPILHGIMENARG